VPFSEYAPEVARQAPIKKDLASGVLAPEKEEEKKKKERGFALLPDFRSCGGGGIGGIVRSREMLSMSYKKETLSPERYPNTFLLGQGEKKSLFRQRKRRPRATISEI